MRGKLLLLGFTGILVAVFLEVALRIWFSPPPIWKEPQIRHLRSPLLGWVLPAGASAFTIDQPVEINSIGLRDTEISIEKAPGEFRILCLGDSFTFALGVAFEDLYVQQLERKLSAMSPDREIQVINAGVAGYNTRQELIYLERFGLDLDPDLIVVGFYWNDLLRNESPMPDLESTPLLSSESDWYDREPDYLIPKLIRDGLRSSVLLYTSVQSFNQIKSVISPRTDDYAVAQRAILEGRTESIAELWRQTGLRLVQIADAANRRGVPVVLMAFPMENQIRFDYPAADFSEPLKRIWAKTKQPFVDLVPAYQESFDRGENPFLAYDLHPNRVGMRIAADELQQLISKQGYLLSSHVEER